jgi:hypothetical protein
MRGGFGADILQKVGTIGARLGQEWQGKWDREKGIGVTTWAEPVAEFGQ